MPATAVPGFVTRSVQIYFSDMQHGSITAAAAAATTTTTTTTTTTYNY